MSATDNSPVRLRRLRELFDAAIDMAASERVAFLERELGSDSNLRRDVEALIDAAERTDDRLASHAMRYDVPAASALAAGQRLGAYDVVRLVGRGGMGVVYEAQRADDQYRKRVAIKVVQAGLEGEITLARFRRERQILANLEHPNIASLVDGGVSADGHPFLVMEYVEGEPITTWCDAHSASTRERVSLFRQVCSAVRHAHANLVVHRDLKPANIFVIADGTVKLLDFGIATLLRDETDGDMPVTREAARAFTPEYASPEQIRGEVLTTGSDVYSLGVVLYELLAGRRPRARDSATAAPPSAIVTDDDARPRSARDAGHLRRVLRGDLDSIVLTALRDEPERRYASVEALDDDLERYLTGRPVAAQRDRAGYRLRKFVRRHRAAFVAGALAVVALLVGTGVAIREARNARREAIKATRISEFLQGILGAGLVSFNGSNRLPQGNLTLRDLLDNASRRLPSELSKEPLVRAQLHRVIGAGYHASLDPAHAGVQYDSALAIHLRDLGPDNLEVARDLMAKAMTVAYVRPDSAEPIVRRALEMYQRHGAPDTLAEYQMGLLTLGEVQLYRTNFAGAESTITRLIASEQHRPAPRPQVLGFIYGQLGLNLRNQGKADSALSSMRRGITLFDSSGIGPSYEEAVHLYQLGAQLISTRNYAEALTVLRRARTMAHAAIPPGNATHMQIGVAIADALSATGDTAEAHAEARASLAMIPLLAKGSELYAFLAEWRYASMLRREKTGADAETAARRQYATALVSAKTFDHYMVDAGVLLGGVLSDRGKFAEAEQNLLAAYRLATEKLGEVNPRTTAARRELVRLYLRMGRDHDAAPLVQLLSAADADSVRRLVAGERARPAK